VLHGSAPATHPLTVFPSPKANQQLELRLLPANNLLSPRSASSSLISPGILPSICSKQAVTLLFYFSHRTTPPFPFSPIDHQEASCSNIFSFSPIKSINLQPSRVSPLLSKTATNTISEFCLPQEIAA
jgi:hypothetical protein